MRAEARAVPVSPWAGVIFVAVALTLYRAITLSQIGLHPDEAYYWLWSRVPSAGYYDHAPMIAWWISFSTRVFGDGQLAVRLLPILSALAVSGVTCAMALKLYGERQVAARAGLWVNATLLVGIAALFATPDAPSLLFWTLTVWALVCLRESGDRRLWLLVGLLAGLGCASKYTNLFLGPGILCWLIVEGEARKRLVGPLMFAGGAVALAVFSPVIVWNYDHHWVSFAKQFGRIDGGHASLAYVFEFLIAQFGLVNPVIAVLAAIGIAGIWRRRRQADHGPTVFLVALSAPFIVYLLVHSIHSRVQANWPVPVYPVIAILAAEAVRCIKPAGHLARAARWAGPAGVGLVAIVLGYYASPLGKAAPFSSPADRLIGWQTMSDEIEALRQSQDAGWIATIDYGVTGELAFYGRDPAHVQEIIDRQRYSFETPEPLLASQSALLIVPEKEDFTGWLGRCLPAAVKVGSVARHAGTRPIERFSAFKIEHMPATILTEGCSRL